MPVFDLRCDGPDKHVLRDEFRMRAPANDDFGACAHPNCPGTLRTYWGETHTVRRADGFVPVTIEGKVFDTRESWNAHVRMLERSHPGKEIVIEGASKRRDRADAEDLRHDLYRDNGIRNEREYHQRMRDLKRSQPTRRS